MTEKERAAALRTIQAILREQFLDDDLVISEDTSPEDIEEWDSLAHVNLLVAVESAFKVRFTADEMGEIGDVRAMLDALQRKTTG